MGPSWTINGTGPCREEPDRSRVLLVNCALLGFVCTVGVSSNVLVCWVAFRSKALQTTNNVLLVHLAVGDLLRCLLDSPLFLASLVLEVWQGQASIHLCFIQQFTFSLCSCAELLSLVAISVERYQAIAFPFKTKRTNWQTRTWTWILLVWVVSFFVAVLSLSLNRGDPTSYMMCAHLNLPRKSHVVDPFGAWVLVPIWSLSIAVITIHYLQIFMVVRRHANKVFDSGVQPRASIAKPEPAWTRHAPGLPLVESSANAEERAGWEEPNMPTGIVGAICILTPKAKELGKKRLEGKLAKRLGYIITVVIIFWLPLVLTLVLQEFVDCAKICGWLLCDLYSSALVVSCVPAALDPLIYTLLQRHFRTQLCKVFSTKPHC
ncbi:D(2) dopamine receptor-like [Astyanax mexicanus]|uniref:D(2) dopamine receptor-like n=1 Tax=Astyanax mexicanus TaxID=7994 RepID=A0A8T2LPU2_ASTMX|nr:D(2) dopamine receptor-like [Astyanax mexicanus]